MLIFPVNTAMSPLKKIVSFSFLFILIPTICFGQWDKEFELNDFSKLLSSHINPYLIEPGAAIEARNLRANKTYGELTKRSAMDTYGTCGASKVTGLHRYYKTNGDQYTICSRSTLIRSDYNNNKTFVTIMDELTDGARWSFETFRNVTIMADGTDPTLKYDGHTLTTANTDAARTAGILAAELGAPFAELNTGANLDAAAWYQYRIAHYDGSVYYYSTARSNPILTGADVHNIYLTDVPLGPPGTTTRYIYRTDGAATRAAVEADTTFKLVGTIADNSTLVFADTTADGSVATPTWATASAGSNITPPVGKFVIIHKESVFLANNPTYTSDVYWSYPSRKDIFNSADYEPIRENDGDEITCLKNQSGVVVVCKTNTIMKIITLSSDDTQWQVMGPYSSIGCQAPYSADNTPKGIAYLAKDGIYIFDGSTSQLISDVITRSVSDILWTSRTDVVGKYFNNEYQLAYTSVESGGSVNNRVIVFDMQRDAYEIDDKDINVFHVFSSGTDEGTLYSGSSTTSGAILAHTETVGNLIFKTKTDFEGGTYDDTDVSGSEQDPVVTLAWNKAFNDAEFVGKGFDHVDYATSTFMRPDTDGTWTSPVVEINATGLDKIYWNEDLGSIGNITFAIRLAATSAGVAAAAYSAEYSDPSGSDISGVTANNYIQIRASLSTTDITLTPELTRSNNYSIKLVYDKEGSAAETSIPTVYKTGALSFGMPDKKKILWEIPVYYTGTSGTINFHITDMEGVVDTSFNLDLSVNPDDDLDDFYTGTNTGKKYTYVFAHDGTTVDSDFFQYELTENGSIGWSIQKIKTRFSLINTGY